MGIALAERDVIPSLKQVLVPGPQPTVFHECRRCGTSLDPESEACAACGSTDIATYEV